MKYPVVLHTHREVNMFLFNTKLFSIYWGGCMYWLEIESTLGRNTSVVQLVSRHSRYSLISYFTYKDNSMTFKIFRELAGVMSKKPIWVCFLGPYMYTHYSLFKLLNKVKKEWKSDRHLIG